MLVDTVGDISNSLVPTHPSDPSRGETQLAYLVGILIGLTVGWLLPWQRIPAPRDWDLPAAGGRLRTLLTDARKAWLAWTARTTAQTETTPLQQVEARASLSAQLHALEGPIQ